jgi:Fe-S-cluster containining protein
VLYQDGGIEPFRYHEDNWRAEALAEMEQMGLPFLPLEIDDDELDFDDELGQAIVAVAMSCPKLGPTGLCTIYETRPQLCRDYVPESDELCVFKMKMKSSTELPDSGELNGMLDPYFTKSRLPALIWVLLMTLILLFAGRGRW